MNALSNLLYGFQRILLAPTQLFRGIGQGLRVLNPLRVVKQQSTLLRGIGGQFLSPFRVLGQRLGIVKLEKRDAGGDLRDLFVTDAERARRRPVAQMAQVSQIHFISGDERYISHIGSGAARPISTVALPLDQYTVTLELSPAIASDARGPVALTGIRSGPMPKINGAAPKLPYALRTGDTISAGATSYQVELLMFDRTPVVTRVDASYATSTGPMRENNEDAIAIAQHPNAYLFAVADGVGAGQDGDEVSAFTCKYLLTAFHQNVPYTLPWPDVLTAAFKHINAEVRAWVRRSPSPAGTTLTAVVLKDWTAYIAHTGDSRLYLCRGGILTQLTQDHMQRRPVEMPTQQAVEQFDPPPLRDVLTRAIGKGDMITPQMLTVPFTPGDKLLLCSDGLTDALELDEIAEIVRGTTAYAAELLVKRANQKDAKDNVTAVVVEGLVDAYVDDIWEAQGSDRVFVGYNRKWSLKLRKPGDPITEVGPTGASCLNVLVVILIIAAAIWILNR